MNGRNYYTKILVALVALILIVMLLPGCTAKQTRPEPTVQIVEVKVEVPVPCLALKTLGDDPEWPDSDAALLAAPDLRERARLLAKGRLARAERLLKYGAARISCIF